MLCRQYLLVDSTNQNDATARYLKGEYTGISFPSYESTQSHFVRPISERELEDPVFKRAIASIARLQEFEADKVRKKSEKRIKKDVAQ